MKADVLVDSSAWIEYFRHGKGPTSNAVDRLLEEDRVVLCGIVELELLQGAKPREQRLLGEVLQTLNFVETERQDFQAAGGRLAELRRRGVTIPASDGLIAALCLRHRLQILTLDAHFDYFPEIIRLNG